jgi:hypothetical protein
LFPLEDNTIFPLIFLCFSIFFVFFILLNLEKDLKECHDIREKTSVTNKKTSSMQWNIPMLDARGCMQDMDTRGDVSSRGKGCQVAKDI